MPLKARTPARKRSKNYKKAQKQRLNFGNSIDYLSSSPTSPPFSFSPSPSSPSPVGSPLSSSTSLLSSPSVIKSLFNFQPSNEDIVELEFTHPRFRIGPPLTDLNLQHATTLIYLSKIALEFIQQSDAELQEGFRLSFSPLSQTTWQLYLEIDQFLWFQLVKTKLEDMKQSSKVELYISNYLSRIEAESNQERLLLERYASTEIPFYPDKPICDYNDNHDRCREMKKRGQCSGIYAKDMLCGCIKKCSLSFHRILHIPFLSGKGFCVHYRLEPSRELVMFSRKHYSPEKLCQKKNFWEKLISNILLIYDEFPLLDCPVQSVCLNVGTWSNQTRHKKKITRERLHGFVHLNLTSEAVLESYKTTHLRLLKGRLEDPQVDRFDYADELKKKKKIEELFHSASPTGLKGERNFKKSRNRSVLCH